METITFEDWALMMLVTGSVVIMMGGLIGWCLFERNDD